MSVNMKNVFFSPKNIIFREKSAVPEICLWQKCLKNIYFCFSRFLTNITGFVINVDKVETHRDRTGKPDERKWVKVPLNNCLTCKSLLRCIEHTQNPCSMFTKFQAWLFQKIWCKKVSSECRSPILFLFHPSTLVIVAYLKLLDVFIADAHILFQKFKCFFNLKACLPVSLASSLKKLAAISFQ